MDISDILAEVRRLGERMEEAERTNALTDSALKGLRAERDALLAACQVAVHLLRLLPCDVECEAVCNILQDAIAQEWRHCEKCGAAYDVGVWAKTCPRADQHDEEG